VGILLYEVGDNMSIMFLFLVPSLIFCSFKMLALYNEINVGVAVFVWVVMCLLLFICVNYPLR
jgi:hypothetical protein